NLERAVSQWQERVRVIVYLKDEPAESKLDDLLRQVEAIPGVQQVRYVSKDEALLTLRKTLGARAEVTEHLPRNPLPASLEVTPDAEASTPVGSQALVQRLTELPGVDEVQAAMRWLEGLSHFPRLFQLIRLALPPVLALPPL